MDNLLTIREAVHFCFLERLFKCSEPTFYVLKGGVNLRFFFGSPRYSEDLDLDVRGGTVATLKKNGYKILQDPAFARMLRPYGIERIEVNAPDKAKQTATTQRFRMQIVTTAGQRLPTKIECSRRAQDDVGVIERIPAELARGYGRVGFLCPHYPGAVMVRQKVRALIGRVATQARDVFDLYILCIGGHVTPGASLSKMSREELRQAQERLRSLSYDDFAGHVVEFLSDAHRKEFGHRRAWMEMRDQVLELLA